MTTVADLWGRLEPYVRVLGPEDDRPRPAVLMFHDCGGHRHTLLPYAEAAIAAAGVRAFVVDSFTPRGWTSAYAKASVCTGLRFHGRERAGDVLAALHGVRRRPDVDASRLMLAGWSHGGWSIMDLMTMPLAGPGETGVSDPAPALLEGVRSLFFMYPYGGVGALSRSRPWVRTAPRALAVDAGRDHLTWPAAARRLHEAVRASGCTLEVWRIPHATHCFDVEDVWPPLMRYDPALTAEAVRRFADWVAETLV